jgi:uncharacterized repeat protein (TIGR02543 family)
MSLAACDGFPSVTDILSDTNVVDTSGESTTESTTESIIEINERIYQIYELAVTSSAFTGTYDDWLESIRGPQGLPGENGKEILLQVFDGYIQWQYVGDEDWTNLISLLDLTGSDGRDIALRVNEGDIQWQYVGDESWLSLLNLSTIIGDVSKEIIFQVFEGYIQWQYVGDDTWTNLLDLSTITGDDGREIILQVSNNFIQWQHVGDETWSDLLDLSTMTGSDGIDGKEITLQVLDGFIKWQYVGDSAWNNLLDLSTMTGSDGKEIMLQVADGYVQWKYDSDSEWHNLIELLSLVGTSGIDGANGLSAYEIYLIHYPEYIGSEAQWIEDLISGALFNNLSYSISFDSNGGNDIADITGISHGSTIDLPIPEKYGYTFMGWFMGQDINDMQFFNDSRLTSDLNLYARWQLNTYIVQFIDDDMTVLNIQEVKHGFSAIQPMNPNKKGYVFLAWDQDFTMVTSDMVIQAIYGDSSLILSFETNGGQSISPIYSESGLSIDLPIPYLEGYQFIGWYDNPDFTGTPVNIYDFTYYQSMVLYAKWTKNEVDGGSFDSAIALSINTMTNANVGFEGMYVHYSLSVPESGFYYIQSYGMLDTVGMLFDENYNNIDYSDDVYNNNFLMDVYLEAASTYYVVVGFYDASQIGNFNFDVTNNIEEKTALEILWTNTQADFYNIWSQYLEDFDLSVDLIDTEISFVPVKALVLMGVPIAVEVPEESLTLLLTYLNSSMADYGFYSILDASNIIVSNAFSMDNILVSDLTYSNGNYYSADMTKLIHYQNPNPIYFIEDYVHTIGSLAFYENAWLERVYIPLTVTEIHRGAFINAFVENDYTIETEYSEMPIGWSELAFNRDIIWNTLIETVTYSFETNGGSLISPIDTYVLDYVINPEKEGYIFVGWYDTALLEGLPLNFPYFSETDITLYAKWIESQYDGQSFESAIPINLDTLTDVYIYYRDGQMYFEFTPSESGNYMIYSLGLQDTYGSLYNANYEFITYNDDTYDTNFIISTSLNAGETYYIVAEYYGDYTIGTYQIMINKLEDTALDLLWNQNKDLFFEIWAGVPDLNESTLFVSSIPYEGYNTKILFYNDMFLAADINPLIAEDFIEELNIYYSDFMRIEYIPDTNIIVSDMMSMNYILTGDVTLTNDMYISSDQSTLIRYVGTATELTIPSSIRKIASFSFADQATLTDIFIPINVEEIAAYAFMMDSLATLPIIETEYFFAPMGWSDLAFSYYQVIIWATNSIEPMILIEDMMTNVSIETPGEYILYSFTPSKSALYTFKSIGLMDTVAVLIDMDMIELAYSDDSEDSNFNIEYHLEANFTYYLLVFLYDELDLGSFDILAEEVTYEPTNLDMIWNEYEPTFNQIWGDFTSMGDINIQIFSTMIYEIPVKILDFSGMIMAIEFDPQYLEEITQFLIDEYGFVSEYSLLDGQNILVSNLLSFDLILRNDISLYNGNYYSSDLSQLVRYLGEQSSYMIEEGVIQINSLAFITPNGLTSLYIPDYVLTLKYGALIPIDMEDIFIISTDFTQAPENWHEMAYFDDVAIIWGAQATPVIYSFDTMDGNEIGNIEAIILDDVDDPIREGYDFLGWYDNVLFEGEMIQFPYYSQVDVTLYAKWEESQIIDDPYLNAIPLQVGVLTDIVVENVNQVFYYSFTVDKTAMYSIKSFGDLDTVAYIYDDVYDYLTSSDDDFDFNFNILIELQAGTQYYLVTHIFSFEDFGTYQVLIQEHIEIESQLSSIWEDYNSMFYTIWGDFFDLQYSDIIIEPIMITDNVSINALTIEGTIIAYEVTEGDETVVNEFMDLYVSNDYTYTQLPATNVYVAEFLSLYQILMGDVIVYGGNFFSSDMTQIVRYMTNDSEVVISSAITKIGSYAFFGNTNIDMVFIPLNVTEIGMMAFGEMGIDHTLEIMTEYSVRPEGWSEFAFFDNVIVHWSEDTNYPIIDENTETIVMITVGGDSIIYEFTPQTTGYYEIYSLGTYDTYAYLYDSYFDYIIDNDDDGEENNFYINHYFEAGVTYYIEVEFWSTIDTGTFSMFVMISPE